MLEDRLRNCHTVLLFNALTKARDGYLLKRKSNVEHEMLVASPNDQVSLLLNLTRAEDLYVADFGMAKDATDFPRLQSWKSNRLALTFASDNPRHMVTVSQVPTDHVKGLD
jgi:hypothetical protein